MLRAWALLLALTPCWLSAGEPATLPYDAIYELATKVPGNEPAFYIWSHNPEVRSADIVLELVDGDKVLATIRVNDDATVKFPIDQQNYHRDVVLRANQPKGSMGFRFIVGKPVEFDPDENGVADYDTVMAQLRERWAVLGEIVAHVDKVVPQAEATKGRTLSLFLSSVDGAGFSLAVVCDGKTVASYASEKDGTVNVPYDEGLWNKHATIVATPATTRFRKNNAVIP